MKKNGETSEGTGNSILNKKQRKKITTPIQKTGEEYDILNKHKDSSVIL